MTQIPNFNKHNIGSFVKLSYADRNDIESISSPDSDLQVTVTFKDGKSWSDVYFTPETGGYAETASHKVQGVAYENELTFFIPKERKQVLDPLTRLMFKRCICRVKTANGEFKIFGSLDFPLTFDYNLVNPPQSKGRNGYNCSFTSKSKNPTFEDATQS